MVFPELTVWASHVACRKSTISRNPGTDLGGCAGKHPLAAFIFQSASNGLSYITPIRMYCKLQVSEVW